MIKINTYEFDVYKKRERDKKREKEKREKRKK